MPATAIYLSQAIQFKLRTPPCFRERTVETIDAASIGNNAPEIPVL